MKIRTILVVIALTVIFISGCVSTTPRNWKSIQEDITKAESFAANDPVSAFLSYRELLGSTFNSSEEQRQGLMTRMAELEPLAIARLSDDYQQAIAKGCLRDVTLLGIIKGLVTNESPEQVQEKIKAYLSEQKVGSEQLIWKVSDVVAEDVGPKYRDNSRPTPGGHGTSITVKSGTLVRISATLSNVSDSGDVQYIRWSLGRIKRSLSNLMIGFGENERLLDNSHIHLFINGTDANCIYVCEDSDIPTPKGGIRITKYTDDKGEAIFPPAFIPKGKSARLNMLFAAPDNIGSAKLRVLGAQPISVTVGAKDK